jgi:hypothetical protein
MIKKLLFACSIIVMGNLNAQDNMTLGTSGPLVKTPVIDGTNHYQSKVASATVVDTLWYFYNKHFYRNPASTGFFTLKNAASYTSTSVVEAGGAVFKNTGTVLVSGAEAVVSRQASSPSASVNVGLFLYNVSGGIPTGAPVASLTTVITGTGGSFIGGNFTLPVTVSGDFAILMKNVSTVVGDTIRLFINNALTAASTSTNNAAKYGEGLGVVQFSMGTSYAPTTGVFGTNTDYEFLVAPRVAYSVTANAAAPTGSCTNTPYTFTNTSSAWFGNPQFNLNQFAVVWPPFANSTASANILPDPVFNWNFGDGTINTVTNGTVMTVGHTFTTAGAFTGTLTAKLQKMSDYNNSKITDAATWSKTYSVCGVGIQTNSANENLNVYPNPAVNGKTNITGLDGANTITVYNLLGQAVFTTTTEKEVVTIDLGSQPQGNYFVRITNTSNQSKTVKIINQ